MDGRRAARYRLAVSPSPRMEWTTRLRRTDADGRRMRIAKGVKKRKAKTRACPALPCPARDGNEYQIPINLRWGGRERAKAISLCSRLLLIGDPDPDGRGGHKRTPAFRFPPLPPQSSDNSSYLVFHMLQLGKYIVNCVGWMSCTHARQSAVVKVSTETSK